MCADRVAVVGAGIAGLSTAYYLGRAGVRPLVFEGVGRTGGLIRTDRALGCTLETGPDSFITTKPAVRELARELGLEGELIASNDAERRIFIVRDGQLVDLPAGMVMMVPSNLERVRESPLFTAETKALFAAELKMKPRERDGDFSIRELVESHLGKEALEYVAEPLLAGVYGGDPAALSAGSVLPRFVEYERVYGSLIAGVQQERRTAPPGSLFLSFREGMGQLTDALAERVKAQSDFSGEQVSELRQTTEGWELRTVGGWQKVGHVVLAVPAYEAARLLSKVDEDLALELAAIPYSSAILVTLLFERSVVRHPLNGFGFLVPRPERKTIAAATWINTKFPSRVADGLVAIRAFLVEPEATLHGDRPHAEVVEAAWADLRKLMAIEGSPVYAAVNRWPASMPQYAVGHAGRTGKIETGRRRLHGLHLASNYIDGVGIPDCVRWGRAAAGNICERLSRP